PPCCRPREGGDPYAVPFRRTAEYGSRPSRSLSSGRALRGPVGSAGTTEEMSPRHRHVLRLLKFLHAFLGAFAPEAGLLDAAERRRRIGNKTAIEADHAEFKFLRNAHATAEILGEQVSHQAIFGVIGALDRLGLG